MANLATTAFADTLLLRTRRNSTLPGAAAKAKVSPDTRVRVGPVFVPGQCSFGDCPFPEPNSTKKALDPGNNDLSHSSASMNCQSPDQTIFRTGRLVHGNSCSRRSG